MHSQQPTKDPVRFAQAMELHFVGPAAMQSFRQASGVVASVVLVTSPHTRIPGRRGGGGGGEEGTDECDADCVGGIVAFDARV